MSELLLNVLKRGGIILSVLSCVIALSAMAQQPDKVYRIGILSNAPESNTTIAKRIDQFRNELRMLGYVDGTNIEFSYRYPSTMARREVEQPALAKELVALKPDVIFTFSSPASDAVQMATRTIPVVVGVSVDRFVKDISHPQGNFTGLSSRPKDVVGKQLDIFREAVPGLKKVAVLWNPEHRGHPPVVKEVKRAAEILGIKLSIIPAARPADFAPAFERIAEQRVDGVLILRGGLFVNSRPQLLDLANKYRIPSMFGHPSEARAGGLMSYGTNVEALFRRAAHYVDRILKGAKPAELPVEQPTTFDLVINLKTAKALGHVFPRSILLHANEVIE